MKAAQLKHIFNTRSRHEQLLLLLLAAVLLAWLLVMGVLHPLADRQHRLAQQNQVALQALAKVKQMSADYQRLRSSDNAGVNHNNSNNHRVHLSNIVDTSVADNELTMRRYQPSASGMAQIRFENMPFDKLIAWLYEVEFTHALVVRDLSMTQGSSSGLANMSVRLGQRE